MLGGEQVAIYVYVGRGAGSYFCPCREGSRYLIISMLGEEQVAISVHIGRGGEQVAISVQAGFSLSLICVGYIATVQRHEQLESVTLQPLQRHK